jgi:hypothetical protein
MAGMLKRRSSKEVGILEKIVSGIPQVVKAIEDLPVDQLWSTSEAAEGSYRGTLRQFGFSESGCHAVTSAIMRRVKGQLGADGLTKKR